VSNLQCSRCIVIITEFNETVRFVGLKENKTKKTIFLVLPFQKWQVYALKVYTRCLQIRWFRRFL